MRVPKRYMVQAGNWRTCPNCGTLNAPSEQFCTNCGYALTGGTGSQRQGASPPVAVAATQARRVTGALVPGELLGGRFRFVQALGKGGFGAVYKAVDTRFQGQRVVAIKEMSDAQLSQSEKAKALEDFRHEANLLVQLNLPYLPNVSDFF